MVHVCRFVGGLTGLHVWFTSKNQTTYEHFRARYNQHGNPYNLGVMRNWAQVRLQGVQISTQCQPSCLVAIGGQSLRSTCI